MRLKDIKPGMAIHCTNGKEKKALLEEAERLRYVWIDKSRPTDFQVFESTGMTINFYKSGYITWSDDTEGVTEFSDLILPEMTAEELLNILNEIIHCGDRRCDECPLKENGEDLCSNDVGAVKISNPDKLISICQQWKANHEKKEPEIETVDICRIIEIQQDGKKRCVHEEDISDGELMYSGDAVENCRYILKNYCKEHDGEFIAVHEVVSRVKAVE